MEGSKIPLHIGLILLREFFSPLFGELGESKADNFTVVGRRDADVGLLQVEEILLILDDKLQKTVSVLKEEYTAVRAGRANPHIIFSYYRLPCRYARRRRLLLSSSLHQARTQARVRRFPYT